ncbi:MAG: TetR/AcrR family transcriptional regulator [Promethearchaeota archaeon]
MSNIRRKKFEKIKKEKRELYLTAAVSVFQEKGFNKTRVKDITNRAGTSVGNFYRYFKSKENIFEQLIEEFYTLIINKLRSLRQKYEVPPIPALKNLYLECGNLFRENKRIFLIFMEQMGGISKEYLKKKNEYLDSMVEESKMVINNLLKIGFIRKQNPEITARIWIDIFLGAFHAWIRSESDLKLEDLVDEIIEFLVRGTVPK